MNWTEPDMLNFKGQEKTFALSSERGVARQARSEWIRDLSKKVSALANSEGGTIILSLKEDREGKRRIADDSDAIPAEIARDQLQRKHVSNRRCCQGARVRAYPCLRADENKDQIHVVFDTPDTLAQGGRGAYCG